MEEGPAILESCSHIEDITELNVLYKAATCKQRFKQRKRLIENLKGGGRKAPKQTEIQQHPKDHRLALTLTRDSKFLLQTGIHYELTAWL